MIIKKKSNIKLNSPLTIFKTLTFQLNKQQLDSTLQYKSGKVEPNPHNNK